MVSCFPGVHRFHDNNWCYQFRDRLISKKANSGHRIPSIFIGDSLVRNFSRKKSSSIFSTNYPDYLNFGIGGDKVENVHYRVKNDGLPKIINDIIILVGTNNNSSNHSSAAVANAIIQLADIINSTTVVAKVIISSISPRFDKYHKMVPLLNEELEILCKHRPYVFIIHPSFPVKKFLKMMVFISLIVGTKR